jgi:basic amino acid/polyamine antiporter, APA family
MSENRSETTNDATKLVRGISRWSLTAIVINTIIGAGIFGLPATVTAQLGGGYSLVAFAVCAAIVALIVLCFAEVSSRFDATGGMYLYAREAFGSVVGFEVGWLYWIARVTTGAANTNLLVSYIGFFYPAATETAPRILIIFLIVLLLTAINFVGVRQSAAATNFFTIGKLLPLILFVAVGLFFVQPANINFAVAPETASFSSAVLILIYAFVGFEAAVIPAGEMRDPQRNLPFALLVALGTVAALYILIQIVCLGVLPELAASKRPIADAASVFLGSVGATVIAAGAIISIFGNLNTGLLTASRLPFAIAEQRELPAFLAKTHRTFKTPYISLFMTSLVILIFTVQSSFLTALTISTITRLLAYAATCAALPVFRRRNDVPAAQFSAPFGVGLAIASLILIVWLLTNIKLPEFISVAAVALVGLAFYFIYRAFEKTAEARTK